MSLSSIVGHRHLIDLLRIAVARDRVPQSLLFGGPEGVGKFAVAVALAQALNCPNRLAGEPVAAGSSGRTALADACGVCSTCRRIARGQHSDVVVIDKGDEASIKIGHLRDQLLEIAGYRPFEARRRVFIIDPADEMTLEAQDALLKTLEEPPSGANLILVTAYPDTLRPTIQSRCRRLRFGPLTDAEVARVLREHCQIEPGRAHLLATAAAGSVSRALAEDAGDVTQDRDAALELLRASARRDVMPRLKAATALTQHRSKRRDREALAARLGMLASFCRDLTALHAGAAGAMANTDVAGALRDLGRSFDTGRLSRAFSTIDRAQQALDRNASPKIVADWVALGI